MPPSTTTCALPWTSENPGFDRGCIPKRGVTDATIWLGKVARQVRSGATMLFCATVIGARRLNRDS